MTFSYSGWIDDVQHGIKTVEDLEHYLHLREDEKQQIRKVIEQHPMLLSRYYLSLIDKNDPSDPLRKMMVPSEHELDLAGAYDTSGELSNMYVKGLQHKYRQTALLLSTSLCAGYCRYCFRKRLVGLPSNEILDNLDAIIDYIKKHPEINNVLVSGGDALTLPTETLERILYRLSALDQLDFIRIGSKVPVVLPGRVLEDAELLETLRRYSLPGRRVYVITQFNHPRELTEQAISAIDRLISANCVVSNQTTLLRGVNDDPVILAELLSNLAAAGNLPYYVFQCRPVKRVQSYFQLPLRKGLDVVEAAKSLLNGQAKRFRFAMSHTTGKIEILGSDGERLFFKYHQAKNPALTGALFFSAVEEDAGWLEQKDLPLPN